MVTSLDGINGEWIQTSFREWAWEPGHEPEFRLMSALTKLKLSTSGITLVRPQNDRLCYMGKTIDTSGLLFLFCCWCSCSDCCCTAIFALYELHNIYLIYREITSWKVRGYDFYSLVVKYHKTNERACERVSFMILRVNKKHTKHFSCCNLFIIWVLRLWNQHWHAGLFVAQLWYVKCPFTMKMP